VMSGVPSRMWWRSGALVGGQPAERVGLRLLTGGLVLEPDPAVVATAGQVAEPAADRQLPGTGLVAAGGVGDLHVRNPVAVGGQGGVDVVAVDGQVVDVEEQTEVG